MLLRIIVIIFILVFFIPINSILAQESVKPPDENRHKVHLSFNKESFIDDFDADRSNWPIITNADNLFIIQDGKYIMHRRNRTSPYAILTKWNNQLEAFHLKTAVRINTSNKSKQNSVGVIFMAQPGGKGAFVIEINRLRQYRIKQLVYSNYHYLSGEERNSGWVKSSAITSKNDFNIIEIKTAKKQYDVFINGEYITSFTEITYRSGGMGLIISSNTKAEVAYFYVYSHEVKTTQQEESPDSIKTNDIAKIDVPEDNESTEQEKQIAPEEHETDLAHEEDTEISGNDLITFTKTIVKLKTQINELNAENQKLKLQINYNVDMLTAIKTLEKQLMKSNANNDSLRKANRKLHKYKEIIYDNENKDILIVLSKKLQQEKMKNDELVKETNYINWELETLKDSLKVLHQKYAIEGNSNIKDDIQINIREVDLTETTQGNAGLSEERKDSIIGSQTDPANTAGKSDESALNDPDEPKPIKVKVKKAIKRAN
ncbi:hypothetical protein JYT51_00870 [Candidatus Amoebophilus asiaticus]|nr:hypothetical protein [Candidatus Amoebophilus asiaticus]